MSTGWEAIGVEHVLDLSFTRGVYEATTSGESDEAELDAARAYIKVLESALEKLGVKVHSNGAVTDATQTLGSDS